MDIKKLRLEKGWSQLRLAAEVSVTENTVRSWEYGASQPNEENYKKLQEVLLDEKNNN